MCHYLWCTRYPHPDCQLTHASNLHFILIVSLYCVGIYPVIEINGMIFLLREDYKYYFIFPSSYTSYLALMQLSIILISCFLFFNNDVVGEIIEFPTHDCTSTGFGNSVTCSDGLATHIFKFHDWDKNKLHTTCGFPCTVNLKIHMSKTKKKLKWIAQFQCHSKAPGIVGMATKKSPTKAKESAIRDFINKAVAAGHVKVEEVQC